MWNRFSLAMMTEPTIQITSIAQMALPHWMLNVATVLYARISMMTMAKFEGSRYAAR